MSKVVVYYSLEGNTKFVAEKIAEVSGADIVRLEPVKPYPTKGFLKYWHGGGDSKFGAKPELKPYTFDGDKYDEVIICMPTWAALPAAPINTFVAENLEVLKTKKISAYAGYKGHGAEQAIEKLRTDIGVDKIEKILTLVDPADKPAESKNEAITDFCK